MGRRLPIFCLGLFSARVRPPRVDTKTVSTDADSGHEESEGVVMGKRIMVVVDSSREAKASLQWALSHAAQRHDTIILLEVVRASCKHGDQSENESYELLYSMRKFCQARKPEVKVEVSLVEGKERGPTIVNESKRQRVSLLVLGHKKRSVAWRLLKIWSANSRTSRGGVAKYCIQNAECMTLAVRRKSRRGGGFLITSRRHKDFWLLA